MNLGRATTSSPQQVLTVLLGKSWTMGSWRVVAGGMPSEEVPWARATGIKANERGPV